MNLVNYACERSLFNAHTMILIVHIFMNVNKLCLNQACFVMTIMFVVTNICCDKKIVATKIFLSRQKTCFVATSIYLCVMYSRLLSPFFVVVFVHDWSQLAHWPVDRGIVHTSLCWLSLGFHYLLFHLNNSENTCHFCLSVVSNYLFISQWPLSDLLYPLVWWYWLWAVFSYLTKQVFSYFPIEFRFVWHGWQFQECSAIQLIC